MKRILFPWFHKHAGPIVSVNRPQYSSKMGWTHETPVLRRCKSCGAPFTTKIQGNWSVQDIMKAEEGRWG